MVTFSFPALTVTLFNPLTVLFTLTLYFPSLSVFVGYIFPLTVTLTGTSFKGLPFLSVTVPLITLVSPTLASLGKVVVIVATTGTT